MKTIVMSIKPDFVAKILNTDKNLIVCKSKPDCDLPITVYVYCSYTDLVLGENEDGRYIAFDEKDESSAESIGGLEQSLNGFIVAKFTLNRVDAIYGKETVDGCMFYMKNKEHMDDDDIRNASNELQRTSCFTGYQLKQYFGKKLGDNEYERSNEQLVGYAWKMDASGILGHPLDLSYFGLKRAPQSWCYVERPRYTFVMPSRGSGKDWF